MRRATTVLLVLVGIPLGGSHYVGASQQVPSKHIIVPGVGVGDYTLGMSKDEVLKKLGEPQAIQFGEDEVVRRGEEKYSLNRLPRECILRFGDISFWIGDDSVAVMGVRGPLYKLSNGLGVGDSWQNIKQAFGEDFRPRNEMGRNYLCYDAKGLAFAIHEKNQAATEIVVYHPEGVPRVLKTLPQYDPDSGKPFQVDLRSRDLSKLDLRTSLESLMYADFDDRTIWPAPDRMPAGFDWHKIMELGKNPGLGVRRLHEKGITGRGVRIAIIDQPLLVGHHEYAGRVRLYEEMDFQGQTEPAMHGAAVASIALGKTVGVAPEAELYYIAMQFLGGVPLQRLARSVHRIIEVNAQLPKDNKIRVISISRGWMPSHEGYKEIMEAVQKAQAAGMLIVCPGSEFVHEGFDFGMLGRSPLADPDIFESYEPGLFGAKRFWSRPPSRADRSSSPGDSFSVPMDSRTTASPAGIDEYVFYRIGGMSWAVPYVAGVYALAVQADPAITPERFWALAVRTGRTIELSRNGMTKPLGPIVDPVRLIRAIQAGETATLNRPQSDPRTAQSPLPTNSETQTIVPGVRVGDYTFGMSKDDVRKKLGEPKWIHWGEEKYTRDNLAKRYTMSYGGIAFGINDDAVTGITVLSPSYRFAGGLGVGDSVEKVKHVFGNDFQLREFATKDILTYEDQNLSFEISKNNNTVLEINVGPAKRNKTDSPGADRRDALAAYASVGGKDLRASDLRYAGDILDTLGFNQETLWPPPERLPKGFDPKNRESVEACTPGFRNGPAEVDQGHIHVPSAPRTVAQADENRRVGYAYDGGGRRRTARSKAGYSDTIPYAAGILALGWQIRPDLSPTQMKELLFASACVQKSGARIINPGAFLELIRKHEDKQERTAF